MPIEMKRAYLEAIRERYSRSQKRTKKQILDEFCAVCGYSRKHAIRILRGQLEPRRGLKPGPRAKYGPEFVRALRELWEAMGRICSKKMVAALPLWLPFAKGLSSETVQLLLTVSPSTIDRSLRLFRQARGISTTQPSMIKSKIPIQLLDHEVTEPGFMESDTVAHCGETTAGTYSHTLTMTDLFSGWTENRAVWGKEAEKVKDKVAEIEKRLPFIMKGFASDNGSEFINEVLEGYLCHGRRQPINFVRRRPYKKNDNAHVEQKNFTHVRELFGYDRFDHPELTKLMNEIYQAYWNPLWNYFTPVMKLKSKTRVGGFVRKEYDEPKTPAQRLIESPHLSEPERARLKQETVSRNPFLLRELLDQRLKIFWKLVDMHRKQQKQTGS